MNRGLQNQARTLLERDRIWSAYALADLEPEEIQRTRVDVSGEAVCLLYQGFWPPVVFGFGDPREFAELAGHLPAGEIQFTLQEPQRRSLEGLLTVTHETPMWRMAVAPTRFRPASTGACERLGAQQRDEIEALFAGSRDRPDAFHSRQLERGVFFGVREGGRLAGVAGTHILAPAIGVAAVGNVFTHPDHRGRGFAGATTSAVVTELIRIGVDTIVLNVSQENHPAVRCYRRLGFEEHCPSWEGAGRLAAGSGGPAGERASGSA